MGLQEVKNVTEGCTENFLAPKTKIETPVRWEAYYGVYLLLPAAAPQKGWLVSHHRQL